ncbi:MAG TPA: glycoside hydrolase family 3 C-terminal domain-containing protein [Fimbriimonadaceae bacterium]|jgi:beta-glucosidase
MFVNVFAVALLQGPSIPSLVAQMTLAEKVSLCHGGTDFSTKAIPRLGIPEYRFTDGPNGVRDQEQIPTTYFPTGISMAATWDPELINRVGVALGQEVKGMGKSVLLGPAVNIDRTPLGGRTFEYESEDPWLNSRICVDYVKGVQSQGVLSCIKHYAVNSIEKERLTVDAQIDERTLREIYLPAFEAAVKEAHVGSVMAAYNKVNGQYCAENTHLMKDILKGEWGFQGFVMSDWGAVHSTVPTALNGLDLEMPGGHVDDYLGRPLLNAVNKGEVPTSQLDEMITRMLTTLKGTEQPDIHGDPHVSTKAHQMLAREVAEKAMVLLKNNNSLLPLDAKSIHTLAVIGPNADVKFGADGGSGSVIAPYEITPLQGLKNYLGSSVQIRYAPGADLQATPDQVVPPSAFQTADGKPGLDAAYYPNVDFKGEPTLKRVDANVNFDWDKVSPAQGFPRQYFSTKWTGFITPPETGTYDLSTKSDDGSRVYIDGKVVVENWGYHGSVSAKGYIKLEKGHRYPVEIDYIQGTGGAEVLFAWKKLPSGRKPWIDEAVRVAKSADKAIVFVGANHDEDTEGSDKSNLSMPDDSDELVSEVLKVRPDAIIVLINGTPVAMPWVDQAHAILEAWYPGMECGNAIADVLFGKANPSGKLPVSFPKRLEDSPAHALGDYPPKGGVLKYDEGVLVGYRWYDAKKIEPLFPFGFGLSYTTFKMSIAQTVVTGPEVAVTVNVANTGRRAGGTVAELYVSELGPKVMRPEKELKAFQKVYLEPGESKTVILHLNKRSFSYYSADSHDWVTDGGEYDLLLGSSSRNIESKASIELK